MKLFFILFSFFQLSALFGSDAMVSPWQEKSIIQSASWGLLYYDPSTEGACQLESKVNGFKLTSNKGEVLIEGNEIQGYKLSCGKETIAIKPSNGDLEIKTPDQLYFIHSASGRLTIESSVPKDIIVFNRNANKFTIKGSQGKISVYKNFGTLSIQSPLGTTIVNDELGKRTFSGPALGKIPYLGCGLFLSFHGVFVFVDVMQKFPMPEIAEWVKYKSIL